MSVENNGEVKKEGEWLSNRGVERRLVGRFLVEPCKFWRCLKFHGENGNEYWKKVVSLVWGFHCYLAISSVLLSLTSPFHIWILSESQFRLIHKGLLFILSLSFPLLFHLS